MRAASIVLALPPVRRAIAGNAFGLIRKTLPKVSDTETQALEAGTIGFDAVMSRWQPIRERMRMQFRAEAFNAFNTPVFASDPDQSPTSTNFGKIFRDNGQSNLPRNIQLGVRFIF